MSKTSDGKAGTAARDWRETLFLPQTDFPMKAGLPQREPKLLARWQKMDLYKRLRQQAKGRDKYILHDGPPYANGHLHIGHALNKILKDMVTRSMQMTGKDSNYVPGWDCHGLPIEWKIEEQYRAKGKDKDAVPVNELRKECRDFAEHWIDIQREEFKRLGVIGDWDNPYTTMSFDAEATIAGELIKFATNGLLFRGSKPVMWSVVERTGLAEAEVEYHEHTSPTVFVKFPVSDYKGAGGDFGDDGQFLLPRELKSSFVVIWTTTPWTIPGNRAICFSSRIEYGLYEVVSAENDFGPQPGEKYLFAKSLADGCAEKAKLTMKLLGDVPWGVLEGVTCQHPLRDLGFDFDVPLLDGDHVTDDAGTGFVHTAPGHGRDDFDIWTESRKALEARGIDSAIPYTVDEAGFFTEAAHSLKGKRVIDDKGNFGDANDAVIKALIDAKRLFARGKLRHDYPHSWRSKKPVIFRNAPHWFIAMDKGIEGKGDTLRARALNAIKQTRWFPAAGENRITGMIESKPDWVLSRQRAWGVPIAVFAGKDGDVLKDEKVNTRIIEAFRREGADAWFAEGAKERLLGNDYSPNDWEKVDHILDVWFDSGSTHAFVMEEREDLKCNRVVDGGSDRVMYLEGSDQHRGWFHSSLLESCGTRGRAPFDDVLTHGFVMAEDGRKMSKSIGNVVAPQDVIRQNGAEILRLWVASSDYSEDLRIGPEILKSSVDAYRKLRNTLRFMLGNLHHYDDKLRVKPSDMPELERYMLHRLAELDALVRKSYEKFDYKRVFSALFNFCTVDLSSVYFDIRKDALYCEPYDSRLRRASLTVLDELFSCLTAWLAPILCFTTEESWLCRFPGDESSVHLRQFPDLPASWRDDKLAAKWKKVWQVRRVVTGALEVERRDKRIGSSLEAAPRIFIADKALFDAVADVDWAEVAITSQASWTNDKGPAEAFRLDEVPGVAVVSEPAIGRKCARSWKMSPEVGSDRAFPDLTPRDAEAVRQFDARRLAAE
ncbi:MAG: isoleucine--tRNA ligase [Pseudomonadota bacterium]|nr:isoleucine--tRNA ligase [Pseudomonadota bacterium]